jgi:hypothetical protein
LEVILVSTKSCISQGDWLLGCRPDKAQKGDVGIVGLWTVVGVIEHLSDIDDLAITDGEIAATEDDLLAHAHFAVGGGHYPIRGDEGAATKAEDGAIVPCEANRNNPGEEVIEFILGNPLTSDDPRGAFQLGQMSPDFVGSVSFELGQLVFGGVLCSSDWNEQKTEEDKE